MNERWINKRVYSSNTVLIPNHFLRRKVAPFPFPLLRFARRARFERGKRLKNSYLRKQDPRNPREKPGHRARSYLRRDTGKEERGGCATRVRWRGEGGRRLVWNGRPKVATRAFLSRGHEGAPGWKGTKALPEKLISSCGVHLCALCVLRAVHARRGYMIYRHGVYSVFTVRSSSSSSSYQHLSGYRVFSSIKTRFHGEGGRGWVAF